MSSRPNYADFDAPDKFQAIQGIIATRLTQHPKAICSYSGGSDSDILLDLIERTRELIPNLPPVKYVFVNTGLEMEATKRHVKEQAEKYGVEIDTVRPKINIIQATRKYGQPFMSKIISEALNMVQQKEIPFTISDEYRNLENLTEKIAKVAELEKRYPKSRNVISWLCGCNKDGYPQAISQLNVMKEPFLLDFLKENPPVFRISAKCCNYCKKAAAHKSQEGYDMVITGERFAEGGQRSTGNPRSLGCFAEMNDGTFRFRPLYYVSDTDKAWYKVQYSIRYSDAYEVYGMKRTGCGGCPISSRAVDNLKQIEPYEPMIVKAAWNIFGDSYRYRQAYNEYKAKRRAEQKAGRQISIFDNDSNPKQEEIND